MCKESKLHRFTWTDWTKWVMIDTVKHLREVERFWQFFDNVLPVMISLNKQFWFNPFKWNDAPFFILSFLSGTILLIISSFQTSLMSQAVIWTERKLCKYETCFFLAVLYQGLLNMQQCQKRIKKFPYHGFFDSTHGTQYMKLTFASHYARSYHMY